MRIPYIIGEAGSCHMGRLETAIELVNIAADAGCDAVKFQFWSVPGRMRARRKIEDPTAYENGSIRPSWFPFLREEANARGMDFICTAYLPEDVETIAPWVNGFKVSSFEVRDQQLLSAISAFRGNKKVFASFGMTEDKTDPYCPTDHGIPYDWHKLYCVSAYPCPLDQANLGAINKHDFDGYSDHTKYTRTGALAVAAGADYLEVHFMAYDTPKECPDYVVSLVPAGLWLYVNEARLVYSMRGTGEWKPQPCEQENLKHRVGV